MSEVVDSKVVELKFNNQEFEKNVKTSLSTIEKLKQNLNFDNVTKGVNTLNSALNLVSLKGISNQVGELVGLVDKSVTPVEAAINTIGSTITNTVGGAIKSVIGQIKSGGMSRAFNIEAAKFSLQGLGIEWDTVKDSINNAVSGTAYGLDQAAKAAAVLSASGIGVDNVMASNGDTLPELERDLKAVSGISAQTGQDFDRIADVFSTIANNGKLMTMQVRQFSTYGLNATADLANYYGVATSDIEDMLQKGEISANDFFDMMYSKYWENAAKANDTVTGVESNIKAALGRIGQAFLTPIIENEGPLNKFLQSYLGAINTIAGKLKAIGSKDENGNDISGKLTSYVDKELIKYLNALTEWLSDFTDKKAGGLLRVWRSVYRFLKGTFKLLQSLINYFLDISKAFNAAFPKGIPTYLLRLAKRWTELTNAIYSNSKATNKSSSRIQRLRRIFTSLGTVLKAIRSTIKAVFRGLKRYLDELDLDPLGMLADAFEYIGNLFNNFKAKAEPFYDIFKSVGTIIGIVVGEIIAFGKAVVEVFQTWDFHPIKFLSKVLKTLTKGWTTNSKTVNRSKNVYKIFLNIIAAVAKALGFIILVVAKVINIFGRLIGTTTTLLSPIGSLISKAVEFGKTLEQNIINNIKKAGGPLDKLKSIFDKIKDAISGVKVAFENTIDNITDQIDNIDISKYTNITTVIQDIQNFFNGIVTAAGDALDSIIDFFSFKPDTSESSSTGIIDTILTGLDSVAGFAISAREKVQSLINKLVDVLSPALENIKGLFGEAFGTDTQNGIDNTNKKLEETGKKDIFKTIGGLFKKLGNFIKQTADVLGIDDLLINISDSLLSAMELDEDATAFDVVIGSIKLVKDFIVKFISIIIDMLDEIAKKYNNSEDLHKLLKEVTHWIIGLDISSFFLSIFNLSSSIKNLTSYLKDKNQLTFYSKAVGFIDSLGEFMHSFGLSILMLAGSFLILVGALAVANKEHVDVKEVEKILGTMAVVMLIMSSIGKSTLSNKTTTSVTWSKEKGKSLEKQQDSLTSISKLLLSFSVAIILMAEAYKIIAKVIASAKKNNVSTKEINNTLLMFVGIIAGILILIGLMTVMSQIISGTSSETSKYTDMGKSKKTYKGQKADGIEKIISSMADLLKGVAVALGVMVVAFWAISKVVSKTDPATLKTTEIILAAMIGAIAVIVIVSAVAGAIRNKNKKNTDKFTDFAESGEMVAFAAALLIMAEAFKTILNAVKGAKPGAIGAAAAIMGVMALALAGIVYIIANKCKRTYSTNAILSEGILAIDMLAFAESLKIMARAFKIIINAVKGAKIGEIVAAGVIMGLMAVALAGIIFEISTINKTSKDPASEAISIFSDLMTAVDMVAFAESLKIMARAFKIMCTAVKGMEEDTIELVGMIFVAMMGALAVIVGEVAISSFLTSKGGVMGVVGETVATIASAVTMWSFVESVKDIANVFKELCGDENIKNLDKTELTSLADMFGTVCTALAKMFSDNNLTLLMTALGAIAGYTKGAGIGVVVGAGIGALIGEFVEWIDGNILIDNIKKVMTIFSDFVTTMKEEQKDVSAEDISYYAQAFGDILTGYADIISANNNMKMSGIINAIAKFVEFIDSILHGPENISDAQELVVEVVESFRDFVDLVKNGDVDATNLNKYADTFNKILTAYASLVSEIVNFDVEFGSWDAENLQILTDVVAGLMESFKDSTLELLKVSVEDYQTIKDANDINQAEAFKSSWSSKAKLEMEKAGQSNINSYTDVLDDSANSAETLANIDDLSSTLANNTVDSLTEAFEKPDVQNKLNDIGTNITKGVSEGLSDNTAKNEITKQSLNVINWSMDAMTSKKGADIHSPSKKFKKKIGKGIIDGIASGFETYKSELENSAQNAINGLVDSLSSTKDRIISTMSIDSNDLTITPVVDLSNVQNATSQISDMFNNQSMNLDSDISSITGSLNEIQNQDPNADLMSAINGLKDNINNNYTNYTVNGVTYDDGSNVASAVQDLISAANIQRRM